MFKAYVKIDGMWVRVHVTRDWLWWVAAVVLLAATIGIGYAATH